MIPIHGIDFSWEDVPQSVHMVHKMMFQLVLTCWVADITSYIEKGHELQNTCKLRQHKHAA